MEDDFHDIYRFHGRRPFRLDDEGIIDFIGVRENMSVLDVGGADGYYAEKMAARGANVTIIDAHEYNFKELNGKGIRTIQQNFCRGVEGNYSMVFMAHVYHDLVLTCKEKALDALKKVAPIFIANLDFVKEELNFGPPSSIKLSKEEVVRDMESIGFLLKKEKEMPYHYLQLFSKE
jgi:hypothetical protein